MSSRSKAQTLQFVDSKVSLFRVPELLAYEVKSFLLTPEKIIEEIEITFCGRSIALRSSAAGEDGTQSARAGVFASVLDISSNDSEALLSAINTVIASYDRGEVRSGDDEFIVQEYLRDTVMSGVVFTHDLNTGAPYYVINYDDVTGLTNTVTSGGGEYANRTLYIHRGSTDSLRSGRFLSLLRAIQELEQI